MTGIYTITNTINGKVYVGQAYDITSRWKQHIQTYEAGNKHYAIYQAFEKYGLQNFSFSVLEELDYNIDLLNEREKYWIATLHSYLGDPACNGYNMTLGGEGNALIDKNLVVELWKQGKSVGEIADILDHDRSAIRKYLYELDDYNEQEARHRGNVTRWKTTGEEVEQYTIEGLYVNTFPNLAEAGRITNINPKNIWSVVSGNSKSAGGYQWKYITDTRKIVDITTETKRQKQPVYRINKDGTTTQFESAAEASRQTSISAIQIRKVCQGKGKTAGGYVWRY